MTLARAARIVLVVSCDAATARARVERFFTEQGWSSRPRQPGRIDYERGSRRRTILLGALAGSRLFLTAQLEIRDGTGDSAPSSMDAVVAQGVERAEIHYRWTAEEGRALGGRIGRARAVRAHEETAAALHRELTAEGLVVRTFRD